MTIKEYTIVFAQSPSQLIKEVNTKIAEGWQPIGGIFISQGPVEQSGIPGYVQTQTISHQSMVR